MFTCPKCNVQLIKVKSPTGIFWTCPSCNGRAATISFLRHNIRKEAANSLWQDARTGNYPQKIHCPACNKLMTEVSANTDTGKEFIDVCTHCQFIWFDNNEFNKLPHLPPEKEQPKLPQEAKEKLAIIKVAAIKKAAEKNDDTDNAPDDWWLWIPGLFGMPVERDQMKTRKTPIVTWSLSGIIFIVSMLAFLHPDYIIQHFGLIPADFTRYGYLTFITSFFLHGGIFHLLSNLYFLLIFGDNIEEYLGRKRYIMLIILSALIGDIVHIMLDPSSSIPCIGASAGISGIITFYALTFPKARFEFLVCIYVIFRWVTVPAYILFIIWIGLQIAGLWAQITGVSDVSSAAHIGGVIAGLTLWLFVRRQQNQQN